MPDEREGFLARLTRWGIAAENALLVLLFAAMMILAVTKIVQRIFFSSGFYFTDDLIGFLVLWITLVASVAASRSDRHLRIDLISQFVPPRYARVPRIVVDLFATTVCAVLAWASYQYVQFTSGETVVGVIPTWIAYGALPLALAIMSYRFLLTVIAESVLLFRGDAK